MFFPHQILLFIFDENLILNLLLKNILPFPNKIEKLMGLALGTCQVW